MKSLQLLITVLISLTPTKSDPDPLDAINLNIYIGYENPAGNLGSKQKEISDYRWMGYGNNGYKKRIFKTIGYEKSKYTKYGRYGRYGRKATTPAPITTPTAATTSAPVTTPAAATTSAPRAAGAADTAVRRITHGAESKVNQYPWIVMVKYHQYLLGGGSLIADKWILTAAHLFSEIKRLNLNPLDMTVVIGEHDRRTTAETSITKTLSIDNVIKHPNYDLDKVGKRLRGKRVQYNDIGLLRLSNPVDRTVYTPVCLPMTGEDFTGKKAWVYGWGTTQWKGDKSEDKSDILLDAEILVRSDEFAKQAYLSEINPEGPELLSDKLLANTIFAGGEDEKDACHGDSGGPLSVVNQNGKHTQIGIVSWGRHCGVVGLPSAYTDVFAHRQWIDLQMKNNGGGAPNCE